MKTPLLDWQAMPCVEFLEWLDLNYRELVHTRMLNANRHHTDIDIYETWSNVLLHIYQQNITGEYWKSLDHLVAWLFTWCSKDAWFRQSNQRQARGIGSHRDRVITRLISELEAEQVDELIHHAATQPTCHAQDLGPGGEDWFSALLDDLPPKQRQAVELTIVGEWTPTQAAEHLGVELSKVKSAKHYAIKGMRKRIESGRVAVPGYGGGVA